MNKTFITPEGKSLPLLPIGFPMYPNDAIGASLKWFTYCMEVPSNLSLTYRTRHGFAQAYKQHAFI